MYPAHVNIKISVFAGDKESLERIIAHRDEPLLFLLRQWIHKTANRDGLLTSQSLST